MHAMSCVTSDRRRRCLFAMLTEIVLELFTGRKGGAVAAAVAPEHVDDARWQFARRLIAFAGRRSRHSFELWRVLLCRYDVQH